MSQLQRRTRKGHSAQELSEIQERDYAATKRYFEAVGVIVRRADT